MKKILWSVPLLAQVLNNLIKPKSLKSQRSESNQAMQCLDIGVEAAGFLNSNPEEHYAKFLNFLYGGEVEDDLFLGLQPISSMKDPEWVPTHELLLRGVGASTHAAPFGVFNLWMPQEERDFILMEIKIATELNLHCWGAISLNCSTAALSNSFAEQVDSQFVNGIIEITDWNEETNQAIERMPNVSIWLDDFPESKWESIENIIGENRNVSGVKISYRDSCIVMGILVPYKTEGVANTAMAKFLSTVSVEERERMKNSFKSLIDYMRYLRVVKLVMEVSCTLDDFYNKGYLKEGDFTDFLFCQGQKDHAMVRRISCDYSAYRGDHSRQESRFP